MVLQAQKIGFGLAMIVGGQLKMSRKYYCPVCHRMINHAGDSRPKKTCARCARIRRGKA